MSIVCIAFGAAAAILFLVSQQAAAHVCIGNALCTAAVHMMMMTRGGGRTEARVASAALWLLGGVGMIIPSPPVAQRMFQCAAFPLMVLVFELPFAAAEGRRSAEGSRSAACAADMRPAQQAAPFLSLRGPIPDFFINGAKKVAANKKDCDLIAAADASV